MCLGACVDLLCVMTAYVPGVKESDGLREETVKQPGGSASDAPVSLPTLHGRKQAVMGGVADDVAGSPAGHWL